MKVTIVYELEEHDAQHMLELAKTTKVLGKTILACCQGDAMEERDEGTTKLAALREDLVQRAGNINALTGERNKLQQHLTNTERRNAKLASAIENHLKGTGSSPGANRRYAELRAALNKPEEAKS